MNHQNNILRLTARSGPLIITGSIALLLTSGGPARAQYAFKLARTQTLEAGYHLMKPGETLSSVAELYGVALEDLLAANELDDTEQTPRSRRLRIPPKRKPAPQQQRPPVLRQMRPLSRVSLTFNNMDVRLVLGQIAEYTRTDIMLTPGAKGAVTLSLRQRTPDEAIRMAAASAGLSAVRLGGAYVVGPAEEVKKATADFRRSEIITLMYAAPAQVKETLSRTNPLVDVNVAGGSVVISGLPNEIAAARESVRALDTKPEAIAPKIETEIFALKSADPAAAEKTLRDAFPDLKVSRTDKTLVLRGVAADLTAADNALKNLDVEPPKEAERKEAFVYRLKFLHAKKAEEALNKAFGQGTGGAGGGRIIITVAPEPTAPPQANFNPLSSAIGGLIGSSGSGGGSGGGVSGGGGGGLGGGGGGGIGGGGSGQGGQGGQGGGGTTQQLERATRLILIGNRQDIDLARQILEQTDLPQQVFRIEAVLGEINKDDFRNLGITWDFAGANQTISIPAAPGDVRFGAVQHTGVSVTAQLQALQTQNKARILAHPNISAMDNEDANIFIGRILRFPGTVVVTQTATIQGTDTVPDGIVLLVRGHYNPEDNSVTLKVHPVISTATFDSRGLPQIASREADTTVRLKPGEELVIGGLDREDISVNLQKVPLLGDIPIIGQFFRSYTHTKTKSEIVVAVRVFPLDVDKTPSRDIRKTLRELEKPEEGKSK